MILCLSISACGSHSKDLDSSSNTNEESKSSKSTTIEDDWYYTKVMDINSDSISFLTIPSKSLKTDDIYQNVTNDNWTEYASEYDISLSKDLVSIDDIQAGDIAVIGVLNNQVSTIYLAGPYDSIFEYN